MEVEPKVAGKRVWGRCNQGENKGKYFTYLKEANGDKVADSFRILPKLDGVKIIEFKRKDGQRFWVQTTQDGEHIAGTYEEILNVSK